MEQDLKIAVLITCFNRRENTKHCLATIELQDLPRRVSVDVFLCDDNSTDGTGAMIAKEFPKVNVVNGNGHLFWGGGMRKAWDYAKEFADFDAYIWLNDDTFLFPDSLNRLIQEYKKIDQPAILTAACRVPNSKLFSYGGHHEHTGAAIPNGTLQEVFYINGNLVLIPKEVEAAIGNISPTFTHYLGDFDYGIRARKAGFPCYTTSTYLAECEQNLFPNWSDPNLSFRKRWQMAHDVKGRAISEYVAFKSAHYGKLVGVKSFVDTYLKLFFTDRYVAIRNAITKN